jgi:hypothetical protein
MVENKKSGIITLVVPMRTEFSVKNMQLVCLSVVNLFRNTKWPSQKNHEYVENYEPVMRIRTDEIQI